MKRLFTLSVLFTALFTIFATNNTAKAQPESFTKDFVMKSEYIPIDGWDNEYHTCNVQVEYDSSTNKIIIKDFFNNTGITNLGTLFNHFNFESNVGSWNDDGTIGTFTFPTRYVGYTDNYSFYHYVWVVNWKQNANVPTKWEWGGDQHSMTVTINLNNDSMTMNKWAVMATYNSGGGGSSTAIIRFNGSTFDVVKTDLVDIVNDGTVGEEYTVTDDLVGVATVDGVLGAPMGVSRNQNSFMIERGRYKLDLDLSTNALTVSQSAEDITGFVNNGSYPTYYVLGQANNNDWNPTVGQPMETTDGVHYSAVVNFDGRDDNKNYFSLTSGLANDNDEGGWNYVNGSCRLGPSYNNYPVAQDVLFAKDFGKYKYPSQMSDGQIDFLGQVQVEYMNNTKLQPVADFDQSNWVMLTGLSDANSYVGKIITGKSITGTLVDKANPTIAVTSNPTAGEASRYEPNIYIMPSFNEDYYTPNSHFFFVAPKVQEYAFITWACYNDDDGNFYTMSDGNTSNLTGGIKVCWDYYPAGAPNDGYVYEFDAIIRKVASTNEATALKDANQSTPVTSDLSDDYLVYPLRLYDVPTAIDAVETTGKVVDVKYYNMMGVESATPFNGVNIEVKTMDNGNRVASKKYF